MEKHNIKDYSQSKIYQLVNSVNGNRYIGSTTMSLTKRKAAHDSAKNRSCKICKEMEAHGPKNFNIVLLYAFEDCKNLEELRAKEQEYILKYKPELNMKVAYTGIGKENYNADYYGANKEVIRAHQKQYSLINREAIRIYKNQYRLDNVEAIKAKRREYNRRADRKEHGKQYRLEHREKIVARTRTRIRCVACSKDIQKCKKARHEKQKRHMKNLLNMQQESNTEEHQQGQPMDIARLSA